MLDNKTAEALAPLVRRPEWDNLIVYLNNQRIERFDRLADCPETSLKRIQGELAMIGDILTLRDNVLKIMSMSGTKTQS